MSLGVILVIILIIFLLGGFASAVTVTDSVTVASVSSVSF